MSDEQDRQALRAPSAGDSAAHRDRPPWIDDRLRNTASRPWRKIHLDFHNTPAVGSVGHEFDASAFAEALKVGHVDSIVLFAKDMHGYFYYPSDRGPAHPGLRRDLLGEQIAACRAAGVRTYAYYCVTWDHYLANQHPDWLVFKRDRTTYLPRFDEVPAWTALCLTAPDFVDHVLADSRELLERYDVDGIWYDMPLPRDGECFCYRCLDHIRSHGGDPLDKATQRAHKQQLLTDFMRRSRDSARAIRPDVEIDQNNQTRIGLHERANLMSNVDVEALPTGGWGYQYFPVSARYSRGFGTPITGLTGRFVGHWADFGGLKHPRQLRVEIASVVAHGAQCSVGDQPGPSARMDPAVYRTIGEAYRWVSRVQPYLEQSVPVVEAAIVVDGLPLTDVGGVTNSIHPDGVRSVLADSVAGTARLMRDARIQFDIVDAFADLDRYRLLVLPDGLGVPRDLAARLADFADGGGAVIAQGDTVAASGAPEPWSALPIELHGSSDFAVPYLVPTEALSRLQPYEYALYGGAHRWLPTGSIEVLAMLAEPEFNRTPQQYTSHGHSPMARMTQYAAAVVAGRVGAIAFPIGTTYRETGYWAYRELFEATLDAVFPHRLLRSDSPSSAELTIAHQRHGDRDRWIVHIVNTTTDVRWGIHLETFDQDLPLHDVDLTVQLPGGIRSARLAESGSELTVTQADDGARVVVPLVSVSELVVLEP
jgi:hypothetical protein